MGRAHPAGGPAAGQHLKPIGKIPRQQRSLGSFAQILHDLQAAFFFLGDHQDQRKTGA